jgi:AraC-like DNA-binding protein
MLGHDFLCLRLVRLKAPDEWASDTEGLCFVFPKGGAGTYAHDSLSRPLSPGDVFVLNTTARAKLRVPASGELLFWWFSVCFEHLFPLLATKEICLLQAVTENFKTAKVYLAASPLADTCHRLLGDVPPQLSLDHRSHLLRIVATILTAEFKSARPAPAGFVRVEEHMSQVFEKLSVPDILNLSVEELAERFSCSRRHLNRLFHQHFGVSVTGLRMEMRLLKAVSLLRDPDAKVINVALQCGFNHLGLFNSCFKRRFGVSPGEWRKQVPDATARPKKPVNIDPDCRLRTIGLCPWADTKSIATPVSGNGSKPLSPPPCPAAPAPAANAAKPAKAPAKSNWTRPPRRAEESTAPALVEL